MQAVTEAPAAAQVRSQQARTSAELAETSKKAVLADRLQGELQEATDTLLQREAELQDLHQDVDHVSAFRASVGYSS